MQTAIVNWSGGKDSCLALYESRLAGLPVLSLLTTLQESRDNLPNRISHHEVSEELLDVQAEALGIPIHKVLLPDQPSDAQYESIMKDAMQIWSDRGVRLAVFGDIFLEDLKNFREAKLASIGWAAHFPLWERNTSEMAKEFIGLGFRAVIVSVDGRKLGAEYCGRTYDETFLSELPADVDPCGEYGEFHTFVFDGPGFSHPIEWTEGTSYSRTYQWKGTDYVYYYKPPELNQANRS